MNSEVHTYIHTYECEKNLYLAAFVCSYSILKVFTISCQKYTTYIDINTYMQTKKMKLLELGTVAEYNINNIFILCEIYGIHKVTYIYCILEI